jgi:hypothetical protein
MSKLGLIEVLTDQKKMPYLKAENKRLKNQSMEHQLMVKPQ